MEHKKAIDVLMEMLAKYKFSAKEKEAILNSIGVLDWMCRADKKIKDRKTKIGKDAEW